MRTSLLLVILTLCASCGDSDSPGPTSLSFFISSAGHPNGGDFRLNASDTDGLAGADDFCKTKAVAAVPAAANRQWRAYLSTSTVNAKDRIGPGPWFNADGTMIAPTVAALHDPAQNLINAQNGLDETGTAVPGVGSTPNQHDIVTGTLADGTASPNTCNNWTSSAASGFTAQVGHFDRMGGGASPNSWNAAHASQGCAATSFPPTAGRGSIYCFAADFGED